MELIVLLLLGILFGTLAYWLATLTPFTRPYAHLIGLVVGIAVVLERLGAL